MQHSPSAYILVLAIGKRSIVRSSAFHFFSDNSQWRRHDYLIDHSTMIVMCDSQGMYLALFNVPPDANKIARDFIKIRDYYQATR